MIILKEFVPIETQITNEQVQIFFKDGIYKIINTIDKKESKDLKLNKDIKAITGIEIQTFIISLEYFKEQLLKEEDKVITHAIKTGFIISGHYLFYKEVLNE